MAEFRITDPVRRPVKLRPNDPCHCGSGRKYKKCCMREDALPPDERGLLDPDTPITDEIKAATGCMLAEEGYTAEVARQLRVLELRRTGRLRTAMAWLASATWAVPKEGF